MKVFDSNFLGIYAQLTLSRESPAAREERIAKAFRGTNIYYTGEYPSWSSAMQDALGYDSPLILEKAISATKKVVSGAAKFERDTVVYDHREVTHRLFCWLIYASSRLDNSLRVMDFGGALGSAYIQHREFLQHLKELRWGVVEQENFVSAGITEFQTEELRYFYTPEECAEAINPNFLLLSGVLQCIENPFTVLNALLARGIPYILIDRTMTRRSVGPDVVAVQHVPAWIYDASYPVWFLDAAALEQCFEKYGYDIVDTFDPHPGSSFGVAGIDAGYSGWFLQKRDTRSAV